MTTAGILGPIVSPSIALIIYGSVIGSSVGKLFVAGLVPALLVATLLITYSRIYSGVFTPTESAAAACLYGWFVGAVIYRNITVKNTLQILKDSGLLAGTLLLITAGVSAFSWVLASTGAATQLATEVLASTSSATMIMMLFNVTMLITGCFLDSASAIIILAPLMQPIADQVGVEPIHLGVITLVNLSVGMLHHL